MPKSLVCRRGRPLGVVILIAAMALACGGAAPAAAPPVVAPRVAARVVDQVPSDTPYVTAMDQAMLAATTFEVAAIRSAVETGLREAVLSPAAAATASVEDRLGSEVARELLPFDDAALRRIGWLPGVSEVVLYGHGLIPVLRLRADGRAALAAWRRISARAGLQMPESSWRGVPYIQLPPRGKRTQTIVIAFLPRQVVATIAMHPDAVLDHLIDEAPAPDPLMPRWRRAHFDPERPADAWPYLWVNASAAAPRVRDGLDLAQLGFAKPPACRAAIADAADALPTLSAMYWRAGADMVASYALQLPPAWRALIDRDRAVAHWLRDARPGLQLGWRVPADELVAGLTAIVAPIRAALQACDDPVEDALAPLARLPLRQLRGGTIAVEVVDGAGLAVASLEALDVGALWSWLQSLLPVGAFPRPGEVRTVPLLPGLTLLAIATSREIGLSVGWPDVARLNALLASAGHPAALVADYDQAAIAAARFGGITLGRAAEGGQTHVSLDADGLLMRVRGRPPAAR